MGQSIGSTWSEIGEIMRAVDSDRVRVCLDTQHSFANGYDVATKEGLDGVMTEFDEHIGLDNLVAVHANDSKVPFEGGLDRHENIGEGHIGTDGFEVIMAHPAFQDTTFLLEVPGFEATARQAQRRYAQGNERTFVMAERKPPPRTELKKLPLQHRIFSTVASLAVAILIMWLTSNAIWGFLTFFVLATALNMYLAHRYNQDPANWEGPLGR